MPTVHRSTAGNVSCAGQIWDLGSASKLTLNNAGMPPAIGRKYSNNTPSDTLSEEWPLSNPSSTLRRCRPISVRIIAMIQSGALRKKVAGMPGACKPGGIGGVGGVFGGHDGMTTSANSM